nr:MAG TPA: hypothetical protein [Bacteriophage sp.]
MRTIMKSMVINFLMIQNPICQMYMKLLKHKMVIRFRVIMTTTS